MSNSDKINKDLTVRVVNLMNSLFENIGAIQAIVYFIEHDRDYHNDRYVSSAKNIKDRSEHMSNLLSELHDILFNSKRFE